MVQPLRTTCRKVSLESCARFWPNRLCSHSGGPGGGGLGGSGPGKVGAVLVGRVLVGALQKAGAVLEKVGAVLVLVAAVPSGSGPWWEAVPLWSHILHFFPSPDPRFIFFLIW